MNKTCPYPGCGQSFDLTQHSKITQRGHRYARCPHCEKTSIYTARESQDGRWYVSDLRVMGPSQLVRRYENANYTLEPEQIAYLADSGNASEKLRGIIDIEMKK